MPVVPGESGDSLYPMSRDGSLAPVGSKPVRSPRPHRFLRFQPVVRNTACAKDLVVCAASTSVSANAIYSPFSANQPQNASAGFPSPAEDP